MKKILLLSVLILFSCSSNEEEIVEQEIEFPEINVQLYAYGIYEGISGERAIRQMCCGSSTSDHCPNNALLVGCYKNFGSAYMIDETSGDFVYDLTTKCNSTIKAKISPGEGWLLSYFSVISGDYYKPEEIQKITDTEIPINSNTVNCFTDKPIVLHAKMEIDQSLNN